MILPLNEQTSRICQATGMPEPNPWNKQEIFWWAYSALLIYIGLNDLPKWRGVAIAPSPAPCFQRPWAGSCRQAHCLEMSWKEWQYHFSVYFKAYLVGRSVIDFWSKLVWSSPPWCKIVLPLLQTNKIFDPFMPTTLKQLLTVNRWSPNQLSFQPFRSNGRRWNGVIGVDRLWTLKW